MLLKMKRENRCAASVKQNREWEVNPVCGVESIPGTGVYGLKRYPGYNSVWSGEAPGREEICMWSSEWRRQDPMGPCVLQEAFIAEQCGEQEVSLSRVGSGITVVE